MIDELTRYGVFLLDNDAYVNAVYSHSLGVNLMEDARREWYLLLLLAMHPDKFFY